MKKGMEKVIEEYKIVMQENTDLKVKLLLKEQFNYQELQYEELSYHDFTNDDLIRLNSLLLVYIHEAENKRYRTTDLKTLSNKVKRILNSKYGDNPAF